MKPVTLDNWSKGASNLVEADRVPEGFVRHAVNVDPLPGGTFAARTGFELAYAGTDVRGVLALGDKLLIADADQLVEFDTETSSSRVLRTISGAGAFVGDTLNDKLFFCTENESLEYDGNEVRPWGVPDVFRQPEVVVANGALQEGTYQFAMTYVDKWGREGGTSRARTIKCEAGDSLEINIDTIPADCYAVLYVSAVNGSTLYEQAKVVSPRTVVIHSPRDDTAECDTMFMRAPSPASRVAAHNGVLLRVIGGTLEFTAPMRPHLCDRSRHWFQFPMPIGEVMSDGKRVYVSADQCYEITGLETDTPSQDTLLDSPAFAGSAVKLPDGNVAWMTRYGQAISSENGLTLVNKTSFATAVAERGAAGYLEHNGNPLIVTSTRGKQLGNELAAADFYIGEILNP